MPKKIHRQPDTDPQEGLEKPATTTVAAASQRYDVPIPPVEISPPARWETFAPTIVLGGTDPETGKKTIRVASPNASSQSALTPGGQVSLTVDGAGDAGKRGEPRARKTLRQKLEANGLGVVVAKEWKDERGQDGVFTVAGQSFTVQFVTAPPETDLWQRARRGPVTREQGAVEWLRMAVQKKGRRFRSSEPTILAVDAQHAGVLADETVLGQYVATYGSPALEFGFASVWVVGPTVQSCARIGEGIP